MAKPCEDHGKWIQKVETLEAEVTRLRDVVTVIRLAQAAMQVKWVIVSVIGMAAVTAIFKWAIP
ncbi:MAG: hypothetical protein ACYTBJ_02320 [Planctomycetota bacterium]|jgi:hypothetical protein